MMWQRKPTPVAVYVAIVLTGLLAGARPATAWTVPDYMSSSYSQSTDLSVAGDLNGDGYSDLVLGNGNSDGVVHVFYGSAIGIDLDNPAVTITGGPQDGLGLRASTAGDVNGDGFDDLIIGIQGWDDPYRPERGAFEIFLGSSLGIGTTADIHIVGSQDYDNLGNRVTDVGDVNGDGYDDVLVAQAAGDIVHCYLGAASGIITTPAWSWNDGTQIYEICGAGDVNGDGYDDFLISGHGGSPADYEVLFFAGSSVGPPAQYTQRLTQVNQINSSFGASISRAGDVNGDGRADIIVGDPAAGDNALQNFGMATVFYGTQSGLAYGTQTELWGNQYQSRFGASVSTAGDFNGDGYADVIIGAHAQDIDGVSVDSGKALLYLGSAAGIATTPTETYLGGINVGHIGYTVAGADVDGDGFSDVFAASSSMSGAMVGFAGHGDPPGAGSVWVANGLAGAQQGKQIVFIGDVNGDGFADAAAGGPDYNGSRGLVRVYYGTATGLAVTPGWFRTGGLNGDQFGDAIDGAGDVDGDGYDDLVIGVPGADANRGRVDVFLGSASGLGSTPDVSLDGPSATGSFGRAAASAGDVNGDGYADLVVGTPLLMGYNGAPLWNMGLVQVFLGSPTGPATTASWTWSSGQSGTRTGMAVAGAGDLDGDGFDDILVGQPGDGGGAGSALVFRGGPGGPATSPAWTRNGTGGTTEALGSVVAGIGDVDADGKADIALGIPDAAGATGRVEIFLGDAGGLTASPDRTLDGPGAGSYFGDAVARAGDVDGDGFGDLLVGAWGAETVSLWLGGPNGIAAPADWTEVQPVDGDFFGFHVDGGYDLDGDGFSDVLIGAPGTDYLGDVDAGLVYCYAGNGRETNPSNPVNARQVRLSGTPIAAHGRTDSGSSFRLEQRGRSAAGRTDLRLEYRFAEYGTQLAWRPLHTGLWIDTGSPGAAGSDAQLQAIVSGLAGDTAYHWQMRTRSQSPYFPTTPWVAVNGEAPQLTHLRTAGAFMLPNLVVTSITPATGNDGQPITVSITIANQGLVAAGISDTRLSLDGVAICDAISTPSLDPLAQTVVTCDLGYVAGGLHVLEAQVDLFDDVAESEEADNVSTSNLSVTSNPLVTVAPDGSGSTATIAAALALVSHGGIIELADGVYTGAGNRDLSLSGKSVTLRSAAGDAAACVIDCQGSASEPHHGLVLTNNASLVLENLTIRGGYATNGSAVSVNGSTLVANDCRFSAGYATNAGGACNMLNAGGQFNDCRFDGNASVWGGGALYLNNSDPMVSMCVFDDNWCDNWGGAVHGQNAASDFEVASCTFFGNGAAQGSAVYVRTGSNAVIGNSILGFDTGGQPVWNNGGSFTFDCNDVFGNGAGDYVGALAGLDGVDDNFSADPLFCDAAGGNYHLMADSPCAPAGNPGCGLVGALLEGCGFVITVAADGSGDQPTIQAALDAAVDGDIIELLDGAFLGAGNRDLLLAGKSVTLRSISGDPAACVIDCEGSAGEPHHGLVLTSGATLVLENLTLRGGYASAGSALSVNNSTVEVNGCRFAAGYATNAGGACNLLNAGGQFNDCRFDGNAAVWGGGALYLNNSSAAITRCILDDNWCDHWGGAVHGQNEASTFTVDSCTFVGNGADQGSAVYVRTGSDAVISNSILSFGTGGQPLWNNNGSFTLDCSDVFGNAAGDYVGALAGLDGIGGNIGVDPRFCEPPASLYSLADLSPCAPANNDCGVQMGARGVGCTQTGVSDPQIPRTAYLQTAAPNPFNPRTTISFGLPRPAQVSLIIYDLSGRVVRALLRDETRPAGSHAVSWNGRDDSGRNVASGTYLYRIVAGDFQATRKMLLVR